MPLQPVIGGPGFYDRPPAGGGGGGAYDPANVAITGGSIVGVSLGLISSFTLSDGSSPTLPVQIQAVSSVPLTNTRVLTIDMENADHTLAFSTGGNGAADSGKVATFGAQGQLSVGNLTSTGVALTAYSSAGYAIAAVSQSSSSAIHAQSNAANGSAFSTHLTQTNSVGLDIDGGSDVTRTGIIAYMDGAALIAYDASFLNPVSIWGGKIRFGEAADYTNLVSAALSGTHTITLPAETGTVALRGANTFTGVQALPNGAVGAPSLHLGDSTTGLYRSAANEIAVSISGALGAKIGASGLLTVADAGGFTFVSGGSNYRIGFVAARGVTLFESGSATIQVSNGWTLASGSRYGFSSGAADGATVDTISMREAANHWTHRNGTTAQIVSISNTWTSTTNFERFKIDWSATANTCRIGTSKGSGGGSARALIIEIGDAAVLSFGTAGQMGFFGTAAVAKPTGVTVDAAGIHAALVTLGLIAA